MMCGVGLCDPRSHHSRGDAVSICGKEVYVYVADTPQAQPVSDRATQTCIDILNQLGGSRARQTAEKS